MICDFHDIDMIVDMYALYQGWRTLRSRVPKLSTNFEGILWRDHGKSEEQNKVLEPSIIIINYCDVINAYNSYNYIINSQYNY
jgi:hypothetical protein